MCHINFNAWADLVVILQLREYMYLFHLIKLELVQYYSLKASDPGKAFLTFLARFPLYLLR